MFAHNERCSPMLTIHIRPVWGRTLDPLHRRKRTWSTGRVCFLRRCRSYYPALVRETNILIPHVSECHAIEQGDIGPYGFTFMLKMPETLIIEQPEDGYRYSVDSLLLADFVKTRRNERLLELGTGCGVISLILARRNFTLKIVALEIQDELLDFARDNVRINGLQSRIAVIKGDINRIPETMEPGEFDHVVFNPPYRPVKTGRICLNAQEALARHEILTNIDHTMKGCRHVLRHRGRLSMVYPAERVALLLFKMKNAGIEPKKLQMVHPTRWSKARICLVEGSLGGGEELKILPPVFINEDGAKPSNGSCA